MNIGSMTISEVYPHLKAVADEYGLTLNRVKDFKLARVLLAIKYSSQKHF
ncbi:hypothetical protein N9981_00045 [bacterium]|nr:hypothetical protein [bacterium]